MAMIFPPPPKTVECRNPDGILCTVFAYSNDGAIQKVRWEPEAGEWVVDDDTAVWRSNNSNKTGWSLQTRPKSTPPSVLSDLEVRVAGLETSVEKLVSVIKNICDEFELTPPQFD